MSLHSSTGFKIYITHVYNAQTGYPISGSHRS